jgi:integrase
MPKKVNRYPGIYQRSGSTTWTADIRWTDDRGDAHQHKKAGFTSQKEAQKYKNKFLADINQGRTTGISAPTLEVFLLRDWLPRRVKDVKPTTHDTYRVNITAYILPYLGHLPLNKLTARVIEDWYQQLLLHGGTGARAKVSRPLTPKSVSNAAGVLNKALRDAVRWDLISSNPSSVAIKPTNTTKEMEYWHPHQLRTFIDDSKIDRLHAVYVLGAITGMRRGELLGLTWDKVDLENGVITIDSTRVVSNGKVITQRPKSKSSVRKNDIDPDTVEALKKWKVAQGRERLRAGSAWQNTNGYLVTDEIGCAIHPDKFTRLFKKFIRSLGLPDIRLHDVRHSYVVAARLAGLPMEIISRRIGHADVGVTMRIYNHILEYELRDGAMTAAAFIRSS